MTQEERIIKLEDALNRACAIGMSTILTRCGAYSELSPYLKAKHRELAKMQADFCQDAFARAGSQAHEG